MVSHGIILRIHCLLYVSNRLLFRHMQQYTRK
jgi:hypothetical protein